MSAARNGLRSPAGVFSASVGPRSRTFIFCCCRQLADCSLARRYCFIRSLLSLAFLSLVYAYFADKRPWMRWALLVATIPIAIGANAIRVAVTGLLSEIDTKLAQGTYHELEGYVVFVVALAVNRGSAAEELGVERDAEVRITPG